MNAKPSIIVGFSVIVGCFILVIGFGRPSVGQPALPTEESPTRAETLYRQLGIGDPTKTAADLNTTARDIDPAAPARSAGAPENAPAAEASPRADVLAINPSARYQIKIQGGEGNQDSPTVFIFDPSTAQCWFRNANAAIGSGWTDMGSPLFQNKE